MNDAERNLISDLFARVRSVETAQRDPEAEAYISDQVARQPHAPYAMAQTIVVQDQALQAAQARIAELEGQLADARAREPAPRFAPEPSSPSPWGPRAQETMARAEAADSERRSYEGDRPQGYSRPFGAPRTADSYNRPLDYGAPPPAQPQAEPSRGGGFLSGALQTAAGVAAGAMLFQGVRSMFGGEEHSAGAGEASKVGDIAQAGGSGSEAASSTGDIGTWYSGLFGGSGDSQAAAGQDTDDQDDDGLFDDGDGDGWA